MRRLVILLVLGFAGLAYGQGDEKPRPIREREVLSERTSGFWTSNRPASGGAYRWRLLGIGGGLVAITGFVMWRLVKRANRSRSTTPTRVRM